MEKEVKPARKKRTFADVRKQSDNLAKRLKQLKERSGSRAIARHADRVAGVAAALEVIGSTDNAAINAEGVEAFVGYMDEAIGDLRAWFKDLINPDNDADLDGCYDEIPF